MEKVERILIITARWLFILCLPVMLFTTVIGLAVNSQCLYEYGFDKYDVSQATGIDDTELEKAASGLISYFNSGEEFIDLTVIKEGEPFTLFNQREVAHLMDVKELIWLDYWVLLATGSYILLYAVVSLCWLAEECRRLLATATTIGGGITLGLILALGLVAVVDFQGFFLQFHLISFTNDLWLLDPTRDYLIMLFPQGFWYDATMLVALVTTGLAVVVAGVAKGYLLCRRRQGRREII
ncbi:MAG: TIGR01906 family membrane protein [Dehalococcoidales bacterium]|nr:TIGR01906 family membrane protein [Dehalococcoidales bacterium]